jgi:ketosteroid isomerase-like protein
MASNREIVTDAFAAWSNGTGYVTTIFAEDMTWEIVGHSSASRKYVNRQEFIDEVLAPFGARFSTEEPFRPVTIRGIYADDASDTVIVLWDGSGMTTAGSRYGNTYAWFMTLRDGAVVDGTAFYDDSSRRTPRLVRVADRKRGCRTDGAVDRRVDDAAMRESEAREATGRVGGLGA